MLVFWSVCLSCLPVCQSSMDDSGHKGNTGQLLNSRVLGVLSVITLTMTQSLSLSVSVRVIPKFLIQPSVNASNRPQILGGGAMNPNDAMISFGNCFSRNNLNKFLAWHDLKIFSCH